MGYDKDWFAVAELDAATFLVSEPKYFQKNNQYLLVGEERALLFDSGCGKRDISPLIEQLTNRPVSVVASHSHYDHIGNHHRFDHIVAPDLPTVRQQMRGGEYRPRLGLRYALRPRRFPIAQLWPIDQPMDLGRRQVELIHLPGHTADSVGLVDRGHGYVLTGDYLCGSHDRVRLGALFPTSSVPDYLESSRRLLRAHRGERLFGAHYDPFPELDRTTIEDVSRACQELLARRPLLPLSSARCGNVTLWAGHRALRGSRSAAT